MGGLHRRGLHCAGPADDCTPEIRHDLPIVSLFRTDTDPIADDGSDAAEGGDGSEVRWRLLAVGNVQDVVANLVWQ
jgi:hypothetical protein